MSTRYVRSVPDVNDVNGTEAIIRVGTDAEAAGRELASTPDHPRPGRSAARAVSELRQPLTGAGGASTAPSWSSSTPRPWLPPFVAPLTFPSARHDFGRLCRTSAARRPFPPDSPRRSHANDVNPQQRQLDHKPSAHKATFQSPGTRPLGPIASAATPGAFGPALHTQLVDSTGGAVRPGHLCPTRCQGG
jgi:hypothetical protein